MHRICVFCGSAVGARPAYVENARLMGEELATRGIELVYGGGRIGLMGALADSVLEAGGRVIGVIPESLMTEEVGHRGLSELHVVASMHERKALMAELSDGFIAMPGGFGTLEEFCEIVTWAQLGLHQKPCGLLNTEGYYNSLLAMLDHAVTEQFIRIRDRSLILEASDLRGLLDRLEAYQPPPIRPKMGPDQT